MSIKNIFFSPTLECNLNCNYCISKYNSGKEHIKIELLLKLLEFYLIKSEIKITFRGGEIFTYKYIKQLFDFLGNYNYIVNNKTNKLSFITNGILVYKFINYIENILKKGIELHITLSTDLDKKGDIRNRFKTEKNYNNFIISLKLLFNLKRKYKNLIILSSSVILWDSTLEDFIKGFYIRNKIGFDINIYGIEENNKNFGKNNNIFAVILFLYNKGVYIEDLIGPFEINSYEYSVDGKKYNGEIYINDCVNKNNIMDNFLIYKRFCNIFNTEYKYNTGLKIIKFYLDKKIYTNYYTKLKNIIQKYETIRNL